MEAAGKLHLRKVQGKCTAGVALVSINGGWEWQREVCRETCNCMCNCAVHAKAAARCGGAVWLQGCMLSADVQTGYVTQSHLNTPTQAAQPR